MKLQEQFSDPAFHSCVATTFCVDFDAYEQLALSRLRNAGCLNNLVLMDTGMMVHAMTSSSALPQFAGQQYALYPVRSGGLFHPKIILQFGDTEGRLIVGSANLTAPGLGGNLEVAGAVSRSAAETGADPIFAAAWDYVRRLIPDDGSTATFQRDWLERRTPWLSSARIATRPIPVSGGGEAMFLSGPDGGGIAKQFVRLVRNRVKRLVVISPYWDEKLDALRALARALDAKEVVILLGGRDSPFPGPAMEAASDFHFHEMPDLADGRFVHAKILLAQTDNADHVLFGSANCTVAALGRGKFGGKNHEACLYRRMDRGEGVTQLRLKQALARSSRLNRNAIPASTPKLDLPLAILATRSPGAFELSGEVIRWCPSPAYSGGRGALDVLTRDREPVHADLPRRSGSDAVPVEFSAPNLCDAPYFARIRTDGGVSSIVPISIARILQRAVVASDQRRAALAHPRLADPEAEEELWLLELLQSLDQGIDGTAGDERVRRITAGARWRKGEGDPKVHRTLTYEEFVRGRTLPTDVERRTDFSHDSSSIVSHFLNRLLGLADTPPQEESDAAVRESLVPEITELHQADEAAFALQQRDAQALRKLELRARKREATRIATTRRKIVVAVRAFNEELAERVRSGFLRQRDLVRLRVMLMIVIAAARPMGGGNVKPIQVLEARGNAAWPKLAGELLQRMFGGPRPCIRRLKIKASLAELPAEVFECWATCLWVSHARHACLAAPDAVDRGRVSQLSREICASIALPKETLRGETMKRMFDALSQRFSERLCLEPADLMHLHQTTTTAHRTRQC